MSKNIKVLFFIIAAVLAVFSFNLFGKDVKNFFYRISVPSQSFLWRAGDSISDFLTSIVKVGEYKNEAEKLKRENLELLSRISELSNLKSENETLRRALGIELQKEYALYFAGIIGKDVSEDSIVIDKGSDDGVVEKMPVITEQKVAVGRISEVYKNYSRVVLISNKSFSFDANIMDKDITGVVRGSGNLKSYLDLIPRDKDVLIGDEVVSSGLSGIFPAGLLVGRIEKVKRNDIESYQQAEITLDFNLSETTYLFIIKK